MCLTDMHRGLGSQRSDATFKVIRGWQNQLTISQAKKVSFITNPVGPQRRLGKSSRVLRDKVKVAKFMVQSPYLSLALGCLQLERWVGVASSTVLRHPEGTTSNKEGERKSKGGVVH